MENINPIVEKKRNTGADFLRILAILLICFFHANQTFRSLPNYAMNGIEDFVTITISPFGTVGNILFIVCSSFFLVDKSKTRFDKAINILMDSTIISITILICFLISGKELSLKTIFHQIFPDIFQMNWFVPAYVIFYLLSPIVTEGIKKLTKKGHFALIVILTFSYGVLSVLDLAPSGSDLIQFFYIFSIVSFVKWHAVEFQENKKTNIIVFSFGIVFCFFLYLLSYYLGKHNHFFNRFLFMNTMSPFLVLPLISLFNLFSRIKTVNKDISYLSGCSLYVYVIHENYLLRTIIRVDYYCWSIGAFGKEISLLYIFLCGLFMFFVGLMLSILYKETMAKITRFLSEKISLFLEKLLNKTFKSFFNKNT